MLDRAYELLARCFDAYVAWLSRRLLPRDTPDTPPVRAVHLDGRDRP